MGLKLGKKGLELIKKYEGLRLRAYKAVPTETYYTVGYGHYGPDVKKDMTITEEQAEVYLLEDCASAVRAVISYDNTYKFSQNQFDALVSFTYNCGSGGLKNLTAGGTRSLVQIAEKITAYNKSGGTVLEGLTRRRREERTLLERQEVPEGCLFEGNDYAPVFDAAFYAGMYPDLKAAFGLDRDMLFDHFTMCGMKEARQGSSDFDPQFYRRDNPDLEEAFGNDWVSYYLHYILCGKAEGRKAN